LATLVVAIVALSFVAGLKLGARWGGAVCPVAALLFGVLVVENSTAGHDVRGLGYAVGVVGAVLALGAWLYGRRVRATRSSDGP
jgi:hypothetical protein